MMMKFVVLCVLLAVVAAQEDKVINGTDTELVFCFLVFRHGDKTPTTPTQAPQSRFSVAYSNDVAKLSELSAPYGFGKLTNLGLQRSYDVGQYIRSRYGELLSPQYNRSEVYLRSTDSVRTTMSLLAALAAVYPPGEYAWSQDLYWTPVPYTTVPIKYDFTTGFMNCPVLMTVVNSTYSTQPSSMKKYKDVLSSISEYVGVDLNQSPLMVYPVFDLLITQLNLGLDLAPEVQKLLPKITEAAGKAIDVLYGNESYIDLEAGVLLKEFFTKAADVIAGTDTQRLRVYCGHIFNVFVFEAVTKISNKQGVPKYGSAYSLEVRRVVETGKYVVLPVYLSEPGSPVKYLKIKGCSQLCDLEKFQKITSPYILDEDTWRTKCGFSKDMVVDDSGIN